MGPKDRSTPALLAAALTLLTVAWLVANPPSAAPDETAHYIKSLGVGGADLVGEAPRAADRAGLISRTSGHTIRRGGERETAVKAAEWTSRTTRTFEVPAGLLSSAFDCGLQRSAVSWACLTSGRPTPGSSRRLQTYIGTYPPFVYAPSGLLARQASDPATGLRLGRAGMAALSLLLVLAAVFLLWEPSTRGLSLVGLMAAVTPMAVFLFSTLSSSGPEIAAAICFTAALLRATREAGDSRWVWVALAVSGVVLALSRQLGPLFLCLIFLGVTFMVGWRPAKGLFAGRGRAAAWSVVAIACGTSVVWDFGHQPHPATEPGAILEVIPSSVKQLGTILRQEVGMFGWLDSALPVPAYLGWLGVLGVLLVLAVRTVPPRAARRLCLLALGVVGCTIVISALHRQTGFTLQGRYVLPLFVLVPLAAGELLHRNSRALGAVAARRLLTGVVTTAALVHAVAWFANGRRVAVGVDGSWLYALNPDWEPPLGWLPWVAVVALAVAAYLGAGLTAYRAVSRRAPGPTHVGAERPAAAAAATATLPYP